MTEATIILLNMRGGCATVGDKVHALFRVNGRSKGNARSPVSDEPRLEIERCGSADRDQIDGPGRPR